METGKPPKQVIIDETLGDVEPSNGTELIAERKNTFQSKRGAKSLGPKPKGAKRVLVNARPRTNRPFNVYKERIVDNDDGTADFVLWWTTEQSEYHGKVEIVKFNPRTEEELTQGYDYTIPFTKVKAKELIERSFGSTSFYLKDGEDTYIIKRPDLEKMFLGDYQVGLTPTPKTN